MLQPEEGDNHQAELTWCIVSKLSVQTQLGKVWYTFVSLTLYSDTPK